MPSAIAGTWRAGLCAALIVALALTAPVPARADVLVDNVNGITLDADGAVQRFTGLLIDDSGRVEQVFARSDKRPGKVDYKLDGKGRVLIPGFVDSHFALMKLGLARLIAKGSSELKPGGQPRPEDRDLALAELQQLLLARGITAVTDMGTTIEDWQTYRRAGDLGALRIRVVAYAEGSDAMILIGGPGPTTWLYDDRLRLNGVKLTLDGTIAAQTAALKAPPAGAPAKAAATRLSDTQLKNLMSRAAMDNFQVAVEANGDKSASAALDAVAELSATYKGERRWRIEGAELVDAADLPRFKDMVVSMAPLAASILATPGEAYAWRSLADAGATLAFGTGATGQLPDPFAGLAFAITREAAAAQPQALTREAALAAYTTGPARAAFAEGRFGRIARGQRADFLLIDRDPLLATPDELRATRVLETWVGGKLAYQLKE